jgi:hypothetical protein
MFIFHWIMCLLYGSDYERESTKGRKTLENIRRKKR